jgi:hypothetical protein
MVEESVTKSQKGIKCILILRWELIKDYIDIKGSSSTSKLVISMNDAGKVKLYRLGAYDFPWAINMISVM